MLILHGEIGRKKSVVNSFYMVLFHEMISRLKTPVAVLRQELGLSVEDFGKLIDKSVSTVTKLENGSLALSDETAHTISVETGVCLLWLLEGSPGEEPYVQDSEGHKHPYLKERFELVQAQKGKIPRYPLDPALYFIVSTIATNNFHSLYAAAEKAGRGQLALYRMQRFLKGLVAEMGKDDEEFLRLNADLRITAATGSEWKLINAKDCEWEGVDGVVLEKVKGGVLTVKPLPRPAIEIPCQDVPHDSDGNTDWEALDAMTAAKSQARKRTVKAKS